MTSDKEYCMSSWLMFRTIADRGKCFAEGVVDYHVFPAAVRTPVHDSHELEAALQNEVAKAARGRRLAIALSGGIDSAILASMMPQGSVAYTFKCVVPGKEVVDETAQAARYAAYCGLEHRVVEVYWEDMLAYAPVLMKHKGAPVHSIEVQIYKAACQVKRDGFDSLVFGESADVLYGGMSGLLSKDRTVGDMIDRYSYVLPYKALKHPQLITEPYTRWEKDGYVDVHRFVGDTFFEESTNSYENACATAGLDLCMPFSRTLLDTELDIARVRSGENKYLVREVFNRRYPGWEIPAKTPMPRPLNEWMAGWKGPQRPEFWPHCTDEMTGDQKWYVWALERFLNIIEP